MQSFFLLVAITLIGLTPIAAQEPAPPAAPRVAANPQALTVAVGDYWIFEIKDEITGAVKDTRKVVITDITEKEIATRFTVVGKEQGGIIIYDRNWNMVSSAGWKYAPNDGMGIRFPLAVNAAWKFSADAINANGVNWKRNGSARVKGEESVKTRAGVFDTFLIESSFKSRNTKNPAQGTEVSQQTWYAPAIQHWVKRATVLRVNGRILRNETIELTEYGHRKEN